MGENISVVIPTFNYGRFIAEAIESVFTQTYAVNEIVVVDDGSTDGTEEVVKKFGDRVRFIRQENQGVCAARNNGVANCSGDFIAFADADDIWLPRKMERQVAKFGEDTRVGLVHCGMREFDSDSGRTLGVEVRGNEGWVAEDLLLWEKLSVNVNGTAIMVSREAFDKVGGFDTQMKVGEDWDFCYRVAKEFKVGFVSEVLFDYRSHGTNAHSNVAEMERGMTRFYEKAFAAADSDVLKLKRRAYGNFHSVLAGSYFHVGQYRAFARHAALSIWNRPSLFTRFAEFPLRRLRRG